MHAYIKARFFFMYATNFLGDNLYRKRLSLNHIHSQSRILNDCSHRELKYDERSSSSGMCHPCGPGRVSLHCSLSVMVHATRTFSSLKLGKYSNHAQLPIICACGGCAIWNDYHFFSTPAVSACLQVYVRKGTTLHIYTLVRKLLL